jgi:hypothetical protein
MAENTADKQIIVDGVTIAYATSVKASPETNATSTPTFDGAITQGMDKVAWNVEISKIRYEDSQSHKQLSELLDSMWAEPKMVTVIETVHSKNEDYTIVDNFFECLLDTNDYEIKPDDMTTESLKFKASKRERKYE